MGNKASMSPFTTLNQHNIGNSSQCIRVRKGKKGSPIGKDLNVFGEKEEAGKHM